MSCLLLILRVMDSKKESYEYRKRVSLHLVSKVTKELKTRTVLGLIV